MTADASGMQALRGVKRKNYFVCAALLFGGFLAHSLALGAFVPALALAYGGSASYARFVMWFPAAGAHVPASASASAAA